MSQTSKIAFAGIDIGKNSFHIVGHDERGAIVLRQKWSRGQVEARFANLPPCLVGMEACVGAHHLSRGLQKLGQLLPWRAPCLWCPHKHRLLVGREHGRTIPLADINSKDHSVPDR